MRDIYLKSYVLWPVGSPAVRTEPAQPGYHTVGKLEGYSIAKIVDVPESVSDHRAVFTFNSCAVIGHTVRWEQLQKGQPVRGQGVAWEPVREEVL